MTDGRADGNHVGYVWLELRCDDDDGSERFLTLGAGLKASTATRRGRRLVLHHRPARRRRPRPRPRRRVPVDRAAEGGARRGGRHRVRRRAPPPRRAPRVRPVRRGPLRQPAAPAAPARATPNIGNRVEAGELANVLSDALPPIDDTGARRRGRPLRRPRHDPRAGRPLAAHGRRARPVPRDLPRLRRGPCSAGAPAAVDDGGGTARARRRPRAAAARRSAERRRRRRSQAAVERAQATRTRPEDERRALERSEAYRAHQDLVDREERVEALDAAARPRGGRRRSRRRRGSPATAEARRAERCDAVAFADDDLDAAGSSPTWQTTPAWTATLLGPAHCARQLRRTPDDGERRRRRRSGPPARMLVEARQRRAGRSAALAVHAERAAIDAVAADEPGASVRGGGRAREAARGGAAGGPPCPRAWPTHVAAGGRPSGVRRRALGSRLGAGRRAARRPCTASRPGSTTSGRPSLRPLAPAARTRLGRRRAPMPRSSRRRGGRRRDRAACPTLEAQTEARPDAAPFHAVRPRLREPVRRSTSWSTSLPASTRPTRGRRRGGARGVRPARRLGVGRRRRRPPPYARHPRARRLAARPAASLADVLVPAVEPRRRSATPTVARRAGGDRLRRAPRVRRVGDRRRPLVASALLRGAWSKPAVEFLGAGARQRTRRAPPRRAARRSSVHAARRRRRAAARWPTAAHARRDELEALARTAAVGRRRRARRLRTSAAAERSLAAHGRRHEQDRRAAEAGRAAASRRGRRAGPRGRRRRAAAPASMRSTG